MNINTEIKVAGRVQRIADLAHRVYRRGIKGYIQHAEGETVPSDGGVGWAKGCIYVQTDGGVGSVLYINDGSETSCDFNVFTASGSVAYDDINAPDANKSLAFAGYTNTWTSTLNGGTVFTISNTTADLTSPTRLLDLKYTDDGDADGLFLRMLDNAGDVKVTFGVEGNLATVGTITVGVDDTGADVQFFGATSGAYFLWDESADTLKLVGGAKFDAQGTVTVGVDDTGYDVQLFGATSGAHLLWDESADTLKLVGGAKTDLQGTLTVGVNDTGYDVKFFGATASKFMVWDESADDLILADAVALQLGGDESTADGFKLEFDGSDTLAINALTANDKVIFGGVASTDVIITTASGTITVDASGDSLAIATVATTITSTLTIGVDDTGHDVIFYGATSGARMLWDESLDDLHLVGAAGFKEDASSLTAAADSGAGSTVPTGKRAVTVAGVTTNADDWIVLPPIADVPIGHTIRIACNASSNFEMRTPASSNTTINSVDSDGTQEYLCTDTDTIIVTKQSTTNWIAQSITALGAVRTAVVPD